MSVASATAQQIEHVVLVSIDGFRPEFYKDNTMPTPNIQWLAEQGVNAKGVKTIFPSVTYPSHTTLITGTLPYQHKVYYNTTIGEDGNPGQWIYDSKSVKAPTLWQAAKQQGLTTAAVSWPISLHNDFIDYNIPEIWNFKQPMDRLSATLKYAHPQGLFEEILTKAIGEVDQDKYNLSSLAMDQNLGRAAVFILEEYKPNLLTVHLPNTDGAQHAVGREGIEVKRAIAGADFVIGSIIDALKRSEIYEQSLIVITGDHGFVNTSMSISPNVWLEDAGLAEQAYFFSTGGSAFLELKDKADKHTVRKVKQMLLDLPMRYQDMFELIEEDQLRARGSKQGVSLAISARAGYSFSNKKEGEILSATKGGKHGHYPNNPEIFTGFIAFSPVMKQSKQLEIIHLEDIAPSIAKVLKLALPQADGTSVLGGVIK